MSRAIKTRFAPSPSGDIHPGNVRTALFSALLAAQQQGVFLLRIEDSDAQRSDPDVITRLLADLRWLGLDWQEGEGIGGRAAPYRQSQRAAIYQQQFAALQAAGAAYPCFCSSERLAQLRTAQRAAGQPPRYDGCCAALDAATVAARLAAGEPAALRFRVPTGEQVSFVDGVRGMQQVATDTLGDFIIRRADGSPAFFFANAVDDALMEITDVVRGEDHLSNTARQLLLLAALDLTPPRYYHLPLLVATDGAKLSKRHGSRSLRELRSAGYLPQALLNYLARLGHTFESDRLCSFAQLAAAFDTARIGRAPAKFDDEQLRYWQRQALEQLDEASLWAWIDVADQALVPPHQQHPFIHAIRANTLFPAQAGEWARRLFTDPLIPSDHARAALLAAPPSLFSAALTALDQHPTDFRALAAAVKVATGLGGKKLFLPLRAALTGESDGPEMAQLLPLLGVERARERLQDALAALACAVETH